MTQMMLEAKLERIEAIARQALSGEGRAMALVEIIKITQTVRKDA